MEDKGVSTKDLIGYRHPNEQEANEIPKRVESLLVKQIKLMKFHTWLLLSIVSILWLFWAVPVDKNYSDSQLDMQLLLLAVEIIGFSIIMILHLLWRVYSYKNVIKRVSNSNYRVMDCSIYGDKEIVEGEYSVRIINKQGQVSNDRFKAGLDELNSGGSAEVILLNCGKWYRLFCLQ